MQNHQASKGSSELPFKLEPLEGIEGSIASVQKQVFFKKLHLFIKSILETQHSTCLKSFNHNKGFYLLLHQSSKQIIEEFVSEIFKVKFNTFHELLKKHGFQARIKSNKTSKQYTYNHSDEVMPEFEKITENIAFEDEQNLGLEPLEDEEDIDQFPRQEEMQIILKQKAVNPKHFLIQQKVEQISLDLKLNSENLFKTPLNNLKKLSFTSLKNEDEENKQELNKNKQRSEIKEVLEEFCTKYKDNCIEGNELIEESISLILSCLKNKSIAFNNDELLNKITGIYDCLSDNLGKTYLLEEVLHKKDLEKINQEVHPRVFVKQSNSQNQNQHQFEFK